MSTVGFAVAGGRSQRMGRDKALLPWADTDLLGHALARLGRMADEVRILPGPERRYTDRGVALDELEVRRPSLEDIYIELTDEAEAAGDGVSA